MGFPSLYLLAKSSRSSIWAKVVDDDRWTNSDVDNFDNQSLLLTISRFSLLRIFLIIGSTPFELSSIWFSFSWVLVSDFPEGSPTWAVNSPNIKTAVCP